MPYYEFEGYDKRTGARTKVVVRTSTSKHARTLAHEKINRPRLLSQPPSKRARLKAQ
jgi:hypothetical protein